MFTSQGADRTRALFYTGGLWALFYWKAAMPGVGVVAGPSVGGCGGGTGGGVVVPGVWGGGARVLYCTGPRYPGPGPVQY